MNLAVWVKLAVLYNRIFHITTKTHSLIIMSECNNRLSNLRSSTKDCNPLSKIRPHQQQGLLSRPWEIFYLERIQWATLEMMARKREAGESLKMISTMLYLMIRSMNGSLSLLILRTCQRKKRRYLEIEYQLKNPETRKKKNLEYSINRLKYSDKNTKISMTLWIRPCVHNAKINLLLISHWLPPSVRSKKINFRVTAWIMEHYLRKEGTCLKRFLYF